MASDRRLRQSSKTGDRGWKHLAGDETAWAIAGESHFFSYCIDNSYTFREQYSGIRRVPQLNRQRFHVPCSSTTSSGPGTWPNFNRRPILLTNNWTKCKCSMNGKGRRQQPPLPHPPHPLPSPNPPPSLLNHLSPKRKRRDERPVPRRRPSLSPSPWQDLHDRQGPGLSLRRWRW